jgi:hypothetical protein
MPARLRSGPRPTALPALMCPRSARRDKGHSLHRLEARLLATAALRPADTRQEEIRCCRTISALLGSQP